MYIMILSIMYYFTNFGDLCDSGSFHIYGFPGSTTHYDKKFILLLLASFISEIKLFLFLFLFLFIDLKKAFDTVPHDILLKKMYTYGIRGNAFKLLKSYLTDRTHYVVYDSKQSETLPIKCGVPQGSKLGPLLFICVMNDIGNVSDFYIQFYIQMIQVYS